MNNGNYFGQPGAALNVAGGGADDAMEALRAQVIHRSRSVPASCAFDARTTICASKVVTAVSKGPPSAGIWLMAAAISYHTVAAHSLQGTVFTQKRLHRVAECTQIDDGRLEESLGFPQFTSGEPRLGWLMNFNAVRCCFRIDVQELEHLRLL